MSEALIVRRGGTGGLSVNSAVIHVNAPLGSTVSFSKSGVVVKTLAPGKGHVNADGETADYYYAINASSFGTWTMTASKTGETSVSETVTVFAANEYDVTLQYIVPAEYQAIEYLQTVPSYCYFDTGIDVTDSDIQTEVLFETTGTTTSASYYLFGTSFGYGTFINPSSKVWYFEYLQNRTHDDVSGFIPTEGTEYHLIYNTLGGGVVLNDISVAGARTRKPESSSRRRLLVSAMVDATSGSYRYGEWRYKKFIVKNTSTDTILADLRPCYRKADHVVGFWDDVSKTFLLNQGTNPPSAGPDL